MPIQVDENLPTKFPTYEVERFKSKIRKTSDCWVWLGFKDKDGYGEFNTSQIKGVRPQKKVRAHRYIYELENGSIPKDYVIDHVKTRGCKRVDCVNPNHLEAVTVKENTLRGEVAKSKKGLPLGVNQLGAKLFVARAHIDGQRRYLGAYKTAHEAHKAYKEANYAT